MNFDKSFERLIGHEGGFQKDPNDRANWTTGKIGQGRLVGTKYGISAMSYPGEDIEGMPIERAKELYRRDFWGPAGCDLVPEAAKFILFTIAVHTSAPRTPTTAIKMLQRALSVGDDGVIGKQTTLAIIQWNEYRLAARLMGQYIDYTNNNREQYARYGAGWSQRAAEILMEV